MKKYQILTIVMILLTAGASFAEEKNSKKIYDFDSPSLMSSGGYAVETDADSAAASLERVSGDIDLGFSAPDQTYDSNSHYRTGPFAGSENHPEDNGY